MNVIKHQSIQIASNRTFSKTHYHILLRISYLKKMIVVIATMRLMECDVDKKIVLFSGTNHLCDHSEKNRFIKIYKQYYHDRL